MQEDNAWINGKRPCVLWAPCLAVLCVLKRRWDWKSYFVAVVECLRGTLILARCLGCILLRLQGQHCRKSLRIWTWDHAVAGLHHSGLWTRSGWCWALFLCPFFHWMQVPGSWDGATQTQVFLPQFAHSEPPSQTYPEVGLNLLGDSNTVKPTVKINPSFIDLTFTIITMLYLPITHPSL